EKGLLSFVNELQHEFKITIGPLNSFLGMRVVKMNDHSVFIGQDGYTMKILKRFEMVNSNPVATPCERNIWDVKSPTLDRAVPFREAVGSLMYLATATRPDIAYAVSLVSEHLENPKQQHWTAVKRILRYLKGTLTFGLFYVA
ncbi:unnamed protein product, partial [Tenebrio molitor]